MDTAAIKSLCAVAVSYGEMPFAHMCIAALDGEEWAMERVAAVLDYVIVDPTSAINTTHLLNHIKFTDTTRPDGAVARSFTP